MTSLQLKGITRDGGIEVVLFWRDLELIRLSSHRSVQPALSFYMYVPCLLVHAYSVLAHATCTTILQGRVQARGGMNHDPVQLVGASQASQIAEMKASFSSSV